MNQQLVQHRIALPIVIKWLGSFPVTIVGEHAMHGIRLNVLKANNCHINRRYQLVQFIPRHDGPGPRCGDVMR
jgi:hypothetical protein